MDEILELYATAATADQIDAGIGVIWWARHPEGGYGLTIVDYDIFQVVSINGDWIGALFERSAKLAEQHKPATKGCHLRVEHPGLIHILERADAAFRDTAANRTINRYDFDIRPVKDYEADKWPKSLDERAFSIRPLVDSGKVVKVEKGLKRFSFRSIRTNHLISQIKAHRPGEAASAGELLYAFVLGVLLGTTRRSKSFFDVDFVIGRAQSSAKKPSPSEGPFGSGYIPGRRPW
jgi:hypothetical protein